MSGGNQRERRGHLLLTNVFSEWNPWPDVSHGRPPSLSAVACSHMGSMSSYVRPPSHSMKARIFIKAHEGADETLLISEGPKPPAFLLQGTAPVIRADSRKCCKIQPLICKSQ